MDVNEGDLYSYAIVGIQTHGYLVKTNEDYMYPVDVVNFPDPHIVLLIHSRQAFNPENVSISPEDINKLIWDRRNRDGRSLVMVYRSGLTKEQVIDLIRPQLYDVMNRILNSYETLVKNAKEMITVMEDANFKTDYICIKD